MTTSPTQQPIATVIITTRNRRDLLRDAVRSAVMQVGGVEVLVVDDASTDGTPDMLRSEFPTVRVEARTEKEGYIVQRNRAVRLASAPIVITIDDDAVFTTPHVVAQAVKCFDHPRIGALAITFANIIDGQEQRWFKNIPDVPAATAHYVGTASAVRRDLFLQFGGYHETYHHWGEELDYCLRLLGKGYFVRLAVTDLIHHFPKHVGRTWDHNALIHRNRFLAVWFNAPWFLVPPLFAYANTRSLIEGIRGRFLKVSLTGIWQGWRDLIRTRKLRQPVSLKAFKTFTRLKREMIPLTEMEQLLPQSPGSPR